MPLFFRLKRPIEATVDIAALTGLTGYLAYVWSQVDIVAAWSLAPYLVWLSFATYLSVSSKQWQSHETLILTVATGGSGLHERLGSSR